MDYILPSMYKKSVNRIIIKIIGTVLKEERFQLLNLQITNSKLVSPKSEQHY